MRGGDRVDAKRPCDGPPMRPGPGRSSQALAEQGVRLLGQQVRLGGGSPGSRREPSALSTGRWAPSPEPTRNLVPRWDSSGRPGSRPGRRPPSGNRRPLSGRAGLSGRTNPIRGPGGTVADAPRIVSFPATSLRRAVQDDCVPGPSDFLDHAEGPSLWYERLSAIRYRHRAARERVIGGQDHRKSCFARFVGSLGASEQAVTLQRMVDPGLGPRVPGRVGGREARHAQ